MCVYACMFVHFFWCVFVHVCVLVVCVCVPQGIPEQKVRASTRQIRRRAAPWTSVILGMGTIHSYSSCNHTISYPVMLLQRHPCPQRHRFRRVLSENICMHVCTNVIGVVYTCVHACSCTCISVHPSITMVPSWMILQAGNSMVT